MTVISRISIYTKKMNSMEIPLSLEVIKERLSEGKLIQEAFPELNVDQREFLLTGATPEEWEEIFGEAEVEYDYPDDDEDDEPF